jgi:hypothetical protein
MLHALSFSLQNAVYFIMLTFLVPALFTFYIQVCQNLNVKLWCQTLTVGLGSSDISGYHADFHEGQGTVGAGQWRGMACVN